MSSAVRSWRTAFLSLRDESLGSPTTIDLLNQLILCQSDTLVAAAPELPPHEVTSDFMLLMELALNISHSQSIEAEDLSQPFTNLSHLIYGISHCSVLEINSRSWALMLDSFKRIVQTFLSMDKTENVLIGNISILKTTKQCLESLRRLFGLYQAAASQSENEQLLTFLLQVVGYFHGKSIYDYHTVHGSVCEVLRIALAMIGEAYSRLGSSLPVSTWQSTIEVLRKVVDVVASNSQLVEDNIIVMFYIELLHCLHLVLTEPRGYLAGHVAGFVAVLRMFFRFGLSNKPHVMNLITDPKKEVGSTSKNSYVEVSNRSRSGPYRPPHLRKKVVGHQQCSNEDGMVSPKVEFMSSDSDCSDNDVSVMNNCGAQFAKARLSAILCIQDLCRADPKSFTSQWTMLLPSTDVLQNRKYETTLMSCLLFDPYLKVRIAAGSTIMALLDGPASVSLQVAEYKGFSKCGSFTALSSSLGHILMQLHTGTLYLIKHETHSRMLVLSFKILVLLISSTPYSRMSTELLPLVISSVQSTIEEGFPHHSDRNSLLAAAINCLSLALSVSPSSTHVNNMLSSEVSTGSLKGQQRSGVLYVLFRYSGQSSSPPLSLEAFQDVKGCKLQKAMLDFMQIRFWATFRFIEIEFEVNLHLLCQRGIFLPRCSHFQSCTSSTYAYIVRKIGVNATALKALAHNYPNVMALCWEQTSSIICKVLSSFLDASVRSWRTDVDQTASSIKERVSAAAIKVLDECLRAISGFNGIEDLSNDKFLESPFTSDYMKTKAISSAPSYNLKSPTSIEDESITYLLASERWFEATIKHMPIAIKHSSAMVRAASMTCFAGMTSSVFFALPKDKQEFIISSSINAALNDEVPSVRSAACRAIGVIACFPQIHNSVEVLEKFIHAAEHNALDSLVSVRITASWALANICDSLSHCIDALHAGTDSSESRKSSELISLLLDSALRLARDNDKVKANAVRALGNLSRCIQFTIQPLMLDDPVDHIHLKAGKGPESNAEERSDSFSSASLGSSDWLEQMVQAFLSCVTTGNVKVQWNVCHALSNLFFNKTLKLQDMDWAASVFSILLLLLRDSSNFKIRIQAAAALAAPETIDDYGKSYYDIVKSVEHVVENFKSDQISEPSNFKYWIALEKQLTSTMLHLLSLAAKYNHLAIRDFLVKKASFLEAWIKDLCSSLGDTRKSLDEGSRVMCMDQKRDVLFRTIQSLVEVYEISNQPIIAQRFDKLRNSVM